MIMLRRIAQIAFLLVIAAVIAVLLWILPGRISANNMENHGRDSYTITADEAAYSQYKIDMARESGISVRLPKITRDNYLSLSLGADDTYRAEFSLNGKEVGSFVIDSGPWAAIADEANRKPILHLIPAYITEKGYDKITLSPLRGDGDFIVSNVTTQTSADIAKMREVNIIDFEIKQLEISISTKNYEIIKKDRDRALIDNRNMFYYNDMANIKISAEGKKYNGQAKLKGGTYKHWKGDKWSLSLEISGAYALWGLQKFSINNPDARSRLDEYVISEWWRSLGGVAIRYDLVDVYINNEYKGVYLLEEHPEKRAVEFSLKRESPVIKLDNVYYLEEEIIMPRNIVGPFSRNVKKSDQYGNKYMPVTAKKTLENKNLRNWAAYAISALNMVQYGGIEPSVVFDYENFAKFYALVDIWNGSHGVGLNNSRLYFNPVTGLLEWVPQDMQPNWKKLDLAAYGEFGGRKSLTSILLNRKDFRLEYAKQAEAIISGAEAFFKSIDSEARRLITVLQRDQYYADSPYDQEFLRSEMIEVHSYYAPESRVPPTAELLDGTLIITTHDPAPILITGICDAKGNMLAANKLPAVIKTTGAAAVEFNEKDLGKACPVKVIYQYYFVDGEYETTVSDVNVMYSFLSAGHFYSNEKSNTFTNYVSKIAEMPDVAFGVLTGDVAGSPSGEAYQKVVDLLDQTGIAWYALPGNHDGGSDSIFSHYLGNRSKYFTYGDDLFILTGYPSYYDMCKSDNYANSEDWALIHQALNENPNAARVFFFTHQVVWWDKQGKYVDFGDFYPNGLGHDEYEYTPDVADFFYNTLLPSIKNSTGKPLYFIAGDIGNTSNYAAFYKSADDAVFVANGLGGSPKDDNILKFNVLSNGKVTIDLIALYGDDPNALGSIYDYNGGVPLQ